MRPAMKGIPPAARYSTLVVAALCCPRPLLMRGGGTAAAGMAAATAAVIMAGVTMEGVTMVAATITTGAALSAITAIDLIIPAVALGTGRVTGTTLTTTRAPGTPTATTIPPQSEHMPPLTSPLPEVTTTPAPGIPITRATAMGPATRTGEGAGKESTVARKRFVAVGLILKCSARTNA